MHKGNRKSTARNSPCAIKREVERRVNSSEGKKAFDQAMERGTKLRDQMQKAIEVDPKKLHKPITL
jgi:hypothetical protein